MVNAVYRVHLIESERGWGQRGMGHKDFNSKVEADAFVKDYNSKNNEPVTPDWYSFAETPVLVDKGDDRG